MVLVLITTSSTAAFYSYDTQGYLQPAREWLATGHYTHGGDPEIFRPPGYSLLFWPGLLINQVEIITLLIQILLSCINIFLIYKLALLLFDQAFIAQLCALLYTIEPLSILYSNKLLSETLFSTILLVFAYQLERYIKDMKFSHLFLCALLVALLTYIRPIAYYLPIYITVVLLLGELLTRQRIVRALVQITTFFIVSMGLIGLWQFRNYLQTGYGGSATEDYNMYFMHGASIMAIQNHTPLYEMQNRLGFRDERIFAQLHPDSEYWTPAQYYNYLRAEGLKLISGNPLTFLFIYIIGMGRSIVDPASVEYLRLFGVYSIPAGIMGIVFEQDIAHTIRYIMDIMVMNPKFFITTILLALLLLGYYSLASITLFQASTWRNRNLLTILAIGLYFVLTSGGVIAADRFRIPIMPFVCLLAGYGCWVILNKHRKSTLHSHVDAEKNTQ